MTKVEARQAVSPADLLKAAVTGKADEPAASPTAPASEPVQTFEPVRTSEPVPSVTFPRPRFVIPALSRGDLRRLTIPGAALAIGAVLGGSAMGLSRSSALPNDAVIALSTTLDAGRTETARLSGDIAQLHRVLADLRASTDTARKEAASRSGALAERLAQLDKNLGNKSAALGERLDQAERDHNTRIANLAAQLDRRAAASIPVPAKAEPTQTGSLAEGRGAEPKLSDAKTADVKVADAKIADVKATDVKPRPAASEKAPVIEGWALRDVYEGTAILENRRRRLVEVAPGDMLPGIGRVEGVERRGREWVVVTRQGLVTPQPW